MLSHPESTLSRLALEAASKGIRTLGPTQAQTLRPSSNGVLTVARGAVWVTGLGPHEGTAEGGPQGDLVLTSGASLAVQAETGRRSSRAPSSTSARRPAAPARLSGSKFCHTDQLPPVTISPHFGSLST